MYKSAIQPNTEYALREKRTPGTPLQRVMALEHIRKNKWKVKWIDPNPGLVDYVESGQLVVPWKEVRAFIRDEESETRLREHNNRQGYNNDDAPVASALQQVFECCGDEVDFHKGSVVGTPDAVDRLRARAGLEAVPESPATYVDRYGKVHIPFDIAIELARSFCAAEPATVLDGVDATERNWSEDLRHGKDYVSELLNEYRASWALIRQWAGHDAAIAQRESQIQRLERLVWDAIYALQKAGLDIEAARLRRAVQRS